MKRWPLNKAYFWDTAPFFRILLPLVAGIIFYDVSWPHTIAWSYSAIIIIASFLLFSVAVYCGKNSGFYPAATFLLLNCMLFFIGLSVSYFSDIRNDKTWFGQAVHINTSYLARISDIPSEKENSWKVPVTIVSSIEGGKITRVDGNAFLYLYKDNMPMLLNKGDSIFIPGNWQPIKNAGNPFEFDYATFCRRNNILYQQSLSVNDIRLYATNDPDHTPFIDKAHDWCMSQLDRYITDQKTKGLIQAMLLGDEVNLDEDLRQSYSETGIVHIIAISGGNVAIFFVVISFLLWWLKDKKHLWLKYTIALPLVWFYVLMAGAQPSAIRAAIMFSLLAFGIILQKNNNSLNQLFATAFLLLCAQPMWLFSVGFQLSFVAVLSLILFYAPIYKWLAPVNKITQLLWGTVAASIAAEILVAPLVIYYFHTFPLLFIVANVIAYLFMSIVLVLGIAIIMLSFVPAISTFTGIFTVWFVTLFDRIIAWLQNLNPTSFRVIVLTNAELITVYIAITGIVLFLLRKNKPALFSGLGACCLLLLLSCRDEWMTQHQLKFVAYNAGKSNHAELINRDTYSILHTDTTRRKKITYATNAAHIYWHATNKKDITGNDIFLVNGKSILLLNDQINTDSSFHVDYVVINYTQGVNLPKIQKIFSPQLLVISNNVTRKQKEQAAAECRSAGLAFYDIGESGAFILNSKI